MGAPPVKVQRIDYLCFHRIEGRWEYVSMDTRATVGIMPASSADRGDVADIHLNFEPFAIPIEGSRAGQLLTMQETIIQIDANHDRKDQYFNLADGRGASGSSIGTSACGGRRSDTTSFATLKRRRL